MAQTLDEILGKYGGGSKDTQDTQDTQEQKTGLDDILNKYKAKPVAKATLQAQPAQTAINTPITQTPKSAATGALDMQAFRKADAQATSDNQGKDILAQIDKLSDQRGTLLGVSTPLASVNADSRKEISKLQNDYQTWYKDNQQLRAANYAKNVNNPDFAQYSKPQTAEGDNLYKYINGPNYRKTAEAIANANTNMPSTYKVYGNMTADEIGIYNYLYNKQGKEQAKNYLDNLYDTLSQREGANIAASKQGKTGQEIAYGIQGGAAQFRSNAAQLLSKEPSKTPPETYAAQAMNQDLADKGPKIAGRSLGQIGQELLSTTTNMAPSILLSAVTGLPAAGTVLLGATAGAGAYKQAIQDGYTPDQAKAYGTLIGASESGLQYLLGGISSLGGKATKTLSLKIAGIDNALARIALQLGSKGLSEATEESLQEVLDPAFKSLIMGTEYSVNFEDVAYAGLMGALSAIGLEGGSTVTTELATQRAKKAEAAAQQQPVQQQATQPEQAAQEQPNIQAPATPEAITEPQTPVQPAMSEPVPPVATDINVATKAAAEPQTAKESAMRLMAAMPSLQDIEGSTEYEGYRYTINRHSYGPYYEVVVYKPDGTVVRESGNTQNQRAATLIKNIITADIESRIFEYNAQERQDQKQAKPQVAASMSEAAKARARDELRKAGKEIPPELQRQEQPDSVQQQRINNGEVSKTFNTEANHIDNRTNDSVTPRNIKAFQFDHPELHQYYVEMAKILAEDADISIASQRSDYGKGITSVKSEALKKAMDAGLTRERVKKVAQDIIDNNGQENYADAKRVELILDSMLSKGYPAENESGERIVTQPNAEYVAAKSKIVGGTEPNSFEQYLKDNEFLLDLGEVTEDELRAEWERERRTAESAQPTQAEPFATMDLPAENVTPTVKMSEIRGYHTPSTKGKESVVAVQGAGLPSGYFIALDKPFESDTHDVSKAIAVTVSAQNVYDPDGVIGKPTTRYGKELTDYINSKTLKSGDIKTILKSSADAYADFLKSKGYDAYARNIDGQSGNRELIIFDKSKVIETNTPTVKAAEPVQQKPRTTAVVVNPNAGIAQGFNYSPELTKAVDTLAKRLGVQVKAAPQIAAGDVQNAANGMYDPATATVYLAADVTDPIQAIISHELTHRIQALAPDEYRQYREYAVKRTAYDGGVKLSDLVNRKIAMYARAGVQLSVDEALDEIAADFTRNLFSNEQAFIKFATEKPSLMQRIGDALKAIVNRIKGITTVEDELKIWQNALDKAAENVEKGLETEFSDAGVKYSIRVSDPPENTIKAYKFFGVKAKEPGLLFPAYVAGDAIKPGQWYDAEVGEMTTVNGKPRVVSKGALGQLGTLAPRPGFHAGEIPSSPQNRTGGKTAAEKVFENDAQVWAEVELAADKNYQKAAETDKAAGVADGLGSIPTNGYYEWNTSSFTKGQWYISGAMKVNRVLSDSEVRSILESEGYKQGDKFPTKEDVDAGRLEPSPLNHGRAVFASKRSGDINLAKFGLDKAAQNVQSGAATETQGQQYSLKSQLDSDGNTLTPEQAEYFKDSKVRDENGNLLVVYHGTNGEFYEFDYSKVGKNGIINGVGFYFAKDNKTALNYGKRVIQAYTDIEKPLSIASKTISKNQWSDFLDAIVADKENGEYITGIWKGNYLSKDYELRYFDEYSTDEKLLTSLLNDFAANNKDVMRGVLKILKNVTGYDGYIMGEDGIYIAFSPEQIKSVDNKNPTSDADIRYSLKSEYTEPEASLPILQLRANQHPFFLSDGRMTKTRLSHLEVAQAAVGGGRTTKELMQFMSYGNVRISGENDRIGVEMLTKPTAQQMESIETVTGDRPITYDFVGIDGKYVKSGTAQDFTEFKKIVNSYSKYYPTERYSLKSEYDDLVKTYGAIEKGEKPARDVQVPSRTTADNRVRQFVRTAMETDFIGDEFQGVLKDDIVNGKFSYTPMSDAPTMAKAQEKISSDFAAARKEWDAVVNGKNVASKEDIVLGETLLQQAAAAKDVKEVERLIAEIAAEGTRAGQIVQSFRLLKQLGPAGQLYYLERTAENLSKKKYKESDKAKAKRLQKKAAAMEEKLKQGQEELKKAQAAYDEAKSKRDAAKRDADIKKAVENLDKAKAEVETKKKEVDYKREQLKKLKRSILDLNTTISIPTELKQELLDASTDYDVDTAIGKIKDSIAAQVPSTFVDKLNAWRMMAMLINPRTQVRNIMGNAVFVPAVSLKNVIGAQLERWSRGKSAKTKTTSVSKERKDFAKADAEKMRTVLQSGGKLNPTSDILQLRRVFKNNVLEAVRQFGFTALETEDWWFLKWHYANSLGQYMQANGLTAESNATDMGAARAYAVKEALKATYRDASDAANALNKLSRMNKVTNILVEGVIPFKKTPINILKRGVEYSPIGVFDGLRRLAKVRNTVYENEILERQAVSEALDEVAAGLSGTGIMLFGMLLNSLGVLNAGADDDEKKAAFDSLQGLQRYSLNVWDNTYTIDWMAPVAIPLFVGAQLMNELKSENDGLTYSDIEESLLGITEPMFNLTMLDGLENTISSVQNVDDGQLTVLLKSMALNYISQYVPTFAGQFSRSIDTTRRVNYSDKNVPFDADIQYYLQKLKNKIPGLSFTSEPYVDAWGRTQKAENAGQVFLNAFENFVSPGYIEKYKTSSMEEELKRLYDATEETVFPSKPSRYFTVNGARKDLTSEEYSKYAKTMGEYSYDLYTAITNSSAYKSMSDDEKVKAIKEAHELALVKGKKAVSNYNSSTQWHNDVVNAKTETAANYITRKSILATANNKNEAAKNGKSTGDMTAAELAAYRDKTYKNKAEAIDRLVKSGAKDSDILSTMSESAQDKYGAFASAEGVPAAVFAKAYAYEASATSDKDEDGETIPNSKRDKVNEYIDKLNLKDTQKDALYLALGYSESTLWETPWN